MVSNTSIAAACERVLRLGQEQNIPLSRLLRAAEAVEQSFSAPWAVLVPADTASPTVLYSSSELSVSIDCGLGGGGAFHLIHGLTSETVTGDR